MTVQRSFVLWPGLESRFTIQRTVVSRQTQFQSLEICDTATFGRALFLDGKPQSAESDEHIYHEALVHPALIAHPAPRRVFIAGGAEGATLRDVLRHGSVEQAVMVDIDGEAVEFARQHMGAWHQGAFDSPRARIIADDARAYLERTRERFDAIVIDVTDPITGGPSYLLFTTEFYRLARERLNEGGVISVQAESASPTLVDGHAAIVRTLSQVFRFARPYGAFVPFFGEPWGFVVASDTHDPAALAPEEVNARITRRELETRFYDGESHRHMFSLPRAIRDALAGDPPVITDDRPLIVA